jgi:predicted AlkP superfamily pyrophosphatase or phosphodiesterase
MREQLWPTSRVVTLSLKARSAIMLAGRRPFASLWFEGTTPVTSTAFAKSLPAFAHGFSALPASALRTWTPLLAAPAYAFEDGGLAEPTSNERFPHAIDEKNWSASPAGDRALVDLASRAVMQLSLGQKASTDLLAVSFSSLDLVGHAFGPRSHEVQDILFRLDVELGRLFGLLDQRLGRDGYVVALSADHGVAALPEQLLALGMDAGRIPMKVVGERMQAQVAAELGAGQWVASLQYTDLYLIAGAYDRLRQRPGALARVAQAIEAVPGVERVFAHDDLVPDAPGCGVLCRAAAASHFPGRSGDFILVPKPNWITVDTGTTHGSSNHYDQRVPVVFIGSGIRPGRYADAASPADIAPTLGAMVGVTLPRPDGRILRAAFAPRP